MYSPAAAARRRCTAFRMDGQPCRAWALWESTEQRCAAHGGRTRGRGRRGAWTERPTAAVPCRCVAYAWPHRPGSGLCEWPNEIPTWRRTTPAGTHSWPRMSPALRTLVRILERRYRRQLAGRQPWDTPCSQGHPRQSAEHGAI